MQVADRHYLYCRTSQEVSCEDNNQEDLKNKSIKEPYDPHQDYLNKVNAAASQRVKAQFCCKHFVDCFVLDSVRTVQKNQTWNT